MLLVFIGGSWLLVVGRSWEVTASGRFMMYQFYVEINQGHLVWLLPREVGCFLRSC